MSDWKRTEIGGLPIYQTVLMTSLPGVVQGFTTRLGGVSQAPYGTLNLGDHVQDSVSDVHSNRRRLWDTLDFTEEQVALAEQVHGRNVMRVTQGGSSIPGADALITDTPHLLMLMFFADCVPVYIVDPVTRAMGLVHAGWRGTVAGIVPGTVAAMQEQFGGQAVSLRAAIGPCIGAESYEVGGDVADQFREIPEGTTTGLTLRSEASGTYSLNLRQVIYDQLLCASVSPENIAVCREDTFQNETDFFSYRRDGRKSGRMAAYLAWR